MLLGRSNPTRSPDCSERARTPAANRSTAWSSSPQVTVRSPSIRALLPGVSAAARPTRSARLRGAPFVGFELIAASVAHLQAPPFTRPAASVTADGPRDPYGKTRIAGMTADPTEHTVREHGPQRHGTAQAVRRPAEGRRPPAHERP